MRPNTRWSGAMRSIAPLRVAPQVDRGEQVVAGPARARSWRSPASTSPRPSARRGRSVAPWLCRRRRDALAAAAPCRSFITSERAPGTSVFRRRARAPASALSGSAPRSARHRRERLGRRRAARFQPCQRRRRARQRVRDLRVLDRALEQRGDRHQKGQQQEHQQWQRQRERAQLAARARRARASAAGRAGRRCPAGLGRGRSWSRTACGAAQSPAAIGDSTAQPRKRSASRALRPGRPRT